MATSSDFRTFQFTDNNEFRRYKHRLNESFGGLRLFIDNKSTEPDHNHKMWLKKKIEEYLTLPELKKYDLNDINMCDKDQVLDAVIKLYTAKSDLKFYSHLNKHLRSGDSERFKSQEEQVNWYLRMMWLSTNTISSRHYSHDVRSREFAAVRGGSKLDEKTDDPNLHIYRGLGFEEHKAEGKFIINNQIFSASTKYTKARDFARRSEEVKHIIILQKTREVAERFMTAVRFNHHPSYFKVVNGENNYQGGVPKGSTGVLTTASTSEVIVLPPFVGYVSSSSIKEHTQISYNVITVELISFWSEETMTTDESESVQLLFNTYPNLQVYKISHGFTHFSTFFIALAATCSHCVKTVLVSDFIEDVKTNAEARDKSFIKLVKQLEKMVKNHACNRNTDLDEFPPL